MMKGQPRAKRIKYNYDLTKTFDVLVGKEPNQQRFTVYHDLLVQRSEFLKAARSSRWTPEDKPTTLSDHDPHIFSTYLHCLYFGARAIKDRLLSIAEEKVSKNNIGDDIDQGGSPTLDVGTNNECNSNDTLRIGNPAGTGVGESDREDVRREDFSSSGSPGNSGQDKQETIEETAQKPQNELAALTNVEERKATAGLSVANLSLGADEDSLKEAFAIFGEMREARILEHPIGNDDRLTGFGYVEFTSAESAANALDDGVELHGRRLRLTFSGSRPLGTAHEFDQDQQRKEAWGQKDLNSHEIGDLDDSGTGDVSVSHIVEDDVSIDYNTSYDEQHDEVDEAITRVLIKLYVLADKLLDPRTANLVIDVLVGYVDASSSLPSVHFINIVYQCTPVGSPLRALFRDWHIHEAEYTWCQTQFEIKWDLPVDFLKDLLVQSGLIHNENSDKTVEEAFRMNVGDRLKGHYHQKIGKNSEK